ncbi:hypothetical protein [Coprobacter fastidiosus]|jgi:hypothetical protein
MEDNDLKKIWKEMHTGMECKSIDIKEIIHKKHSVVISRILHRQKSLICLFAFFFILSVTSNIWHSVLMGRASFPLWVVNIFLLFILFSVIWGYRLFIKSADLCSVKESGIILKKQLERKMHFDFIICLVFFYGMAIRFIIMYLNQFDELKEMSYILVFFIVLFLAIPWLMRYYQKCRYKSYLLSLERGWKLLDEIE